MWIYANPNPCRQEEPDCVVRAISIATDQPWKKVHRDLCLLSLDHCTMPSVNWLWGLYLENKGYEKFLLPENCPSCLSVRDFCKMYPEGVYVVGTGTHAIACINGNYWDTWDSGDETPTFFYRKRVKKHA
jgi:hypothetical protein